MHHFFEAITNKKGDALVGYYVQAIDTDTESVATIYADSSSTPIVSVSEVADMAKVDEDGNASFYIASGSYHLDIYATDATTLVRRIDNLPMVDTAGDAATASAAAASATASAASAAAFANFNAGNTGSVTRTAASKLGDVVSVKDFGAVGDGSTDDTTNLLAAFQHGCSTGQRIHVPAGTYLVDPNELEMLTVGSTRFVMSGEGASSIIKVKDGTITADFMWMFQFEPSTDMDLIEMRDLVLDHNARGSTAPASDFDYQHSHTLNVQVPSGVTVKQVRFSNIIIKDPAADGFNNDGAGTVTTYTVSNCAEIDRTRVRSSIQFSRLPTNAIITGFNGKTIEFETVANVSALTRVQISNTNVERLDLDGFTGDQASRLIEVYLSNVTTSDSTYFQHILLRAANCRIMLPSDGRWDRLCEGSRLDSCQIVHPYTAGTPGSIVSFDHRWATTYKTRLTISNCDFVIDSTDSSITPTGPMVYPQGVLPVANIADSLLVIDNCRFDSRCQYSVRAYRCGTVRLRGNRYGGTTGAIFYGTSTNNGIDLTVDGGDFSRVTGAAFYGIWLSVDQSTTIAYARLTGDWVGVTTPVSTSSGTLSATFDNQFINNRRMSMSAKPTGGIIGDIIDIYGAADGAVDSYRCTTSSVSAGTFRGRSFAGAIGFTTGSGGTITQATSKATGVTLNKACGTITMNAAALAANTAVTFTLTNSFIAAGDRLVLNHVSGGTFGAYTMDAQSAAGTATIMVRNLTAGSLSEAVVIGFAVVKAVTA